MSLGGSDTVWIRNGSDFTSPLLLTLTSNSSAQSVTGSTANLYVLFSLGDYQAATFIITFAGSPRNSDVLFDRESVPVMTQLGYCWQTGMRGIEAVLVCLQTTPCRVHHHRTTTGMVTMMAKSSSLASVQPELYSWLWP